MANTDITKNIVNIQNNKLDFTTSASGTNTFNVTLKSTKVLEVSESGKIKALLTEAVPTSLKTAEKYDFSGYISNINNHSIGNLSDVTISSPTNSQILHHNGQNWENKNLSEILPSSVLKVSGDADDVQNIVVGTDTFNITGNNDTIKVSLLTGGTNKGIGLTLADQVKINTSLQVGTNPGSFKVQDDGTNGFQVKALNSSTFALNQTSGGQTTLNSASGQNVIISNGGTAALTASANAVTVNNLVVSGNLTVNGTNTILNTEVKLIEDSIIELNYTSGTHHNLDYDIGFAGRYSNDNKYCGFVYDTSANHFKVFDSMTGFGDNTKKIGDEDGSFANIVGMGFDARNGQIGSQLRVITGATNPETFILKDLLGDYYGLANYGIYSGRLIACSYSTNFLSYAITTLNYNLNINSGGLVFFATVDLEEKGGWGNHLSYDDSNGSIRYVIPLNLSHGIPTILIRLLPITAINF